MGISSADAFLLELSLTFTERYLAILHKEAIKGYLTKKIVISKKGGGQLFKKQRLDPVHPKPLKIRFALKATSPGQHKFGACSLWSSIANPLLFLLILI